MMRSRLMPFFFMGCFCSTLVACSFIQRTTQQVKDTGQAIEQRGRNVIGALSGAVRQAVDTGKEVVGEAKKKIGDVVEGVGKIQEGINQVKGLQSQSSSLQ